MHRKTNDERIAFVDTLQPPSHRTRHILLNLLFATVIVYLLFLVVWLITRTLFGDRWWWLFLLNAVTPYLLMPLPLLILPAIIARRWFAVALSIPLFVISAPLLIDPWLRFDTARYGFSSQGAPFRVMTFNINGGNERTDRVLAAIRAAQPDIIALQELNPSIAAALERDLKNDYPYQFLDPQWGVTGMGIISRFRSAHSLHACRVIAGSARRRRSRSTLRGRPSPCSTSTLSRRSDRPSI